MKEKYRDSSLSPEERAEDLLGRMTVEEKTAQLLSIPAIEAEVKGNSVEVKGLKEKVVYGIGSFQLPGRNFMPGTSARIINKLQEIVMEQSRFSIPALIQEECLNGHVAQGASMFPKPVGMAATFDTGLVNQVYRSIGREAAARGGSMAFTPVLDLGRDLRWGRLEETFGEDVYLVSQMGYAAVTGLQGGTDGVEKGYIAACVKHFAGYGQCDGGRNFAPCHVTDRTLSDEILPPFYKAVTEGKASGVMPSHSEIDGIPCHGNHWLLEELLRNQWGFQGLVVSDYYDISRLETVHHVAGNAQESAQKALDAGVDMDLPDGASYRNLPELCREKTDIGPLLDRAVKRVLTLKFRLGLFEQPFADPDKAEQLVRCEEHRKLSLKVAQESLILLKNEEDFLPLGRGNKKIAVIGPCAHPVHFGYYSAAPCQGISIYEGIKNYAEKYGAGVFYEKGCSLTKQEFFMDTEVDATMMEEPEIFTREEELESMKKAVRLVRDSDIAVVCVGGSAATSREAIYKNNSCGDNDSLELIGQQKELLTMIAETGKKFVVISVGGKPYGSKELYEKPAAVIQCFYAGQETGNAVASVLFGEAEPGGRLPVTIPYNVGQMPLYYSQKASGLMKGYLLGAKKERYPFGYGMGYTTFEMLSLKMDKKELAPDGELHVSERIKNTGSRAGTAVIQLYLRDMVASVTRPAMELKGFQRVYLNPGEEKDVSFVITEKMLRFTRADGIYASEPGEFQVMSGLSSREYLKDTFVLKEEKNETV